jgi:hypothetical protein
MPQFSGSQATKEERRWRGTKKQRHVSLPPNQKRIMMKDCSLLTTFLLLLTDA